MKDILFTAAIIILLSVGSCKDNETREGEMVAPESTEAETGTTAADMAADTTSTAEEDSLIEAPSP